MTTAIAAVILIGTMFSAMPSAAWAAPKKKKEEPVADKQSYVIPYMIVIFGVGLGLMTVCRASPRADKSGASSKKKQDD